MVAAIGLRQYAIKAFRTMHPREYDNFQQANIINQVTSILGYRSRFLPRVSPRAVTLTQLDSLALGVQGGVSGLRMLHHLNRNSAKNVRVKARTSSYRTKSSKGQISPHTQQTTPFPSGCSLLMRIQDDWCRMIKASPRPRAWLGKGWDRLAQCCWLVSELWLLSLIHI